MLCLLLCSLEDIFFGFIKKKKSEDENSSRFRVETIYNYCKAKRRNVSIGLEHEEDSSWNLAPSKVDGGNKWNSASGSFYFSLT